LKAPADTREVIVTFAVNQLWAGDAQLRVRIHPPDQTF
jgi:hypothetical protein